MKYLKSNDVQALIISVAVRRTYEKMEIFYVCSNLCSIFFIRVLYGKSLKRRKQTESSELNARLF